MGHERPVEPFADLHVEHGQVRATLLHDPTVEDSIWQCTSMAPAA